MECGTSIKDGYSACYYQSNYGGSYVTNPLVPVTPPRQVHGVSFPAFPAQGEGSGLSIDLILCPGSSLSLSFQAAALVQPVSLWARLGASAGLLPSVTSSYHPAPSHVAWRHGDEPDD